jgi:shikimate kinase
MKKNIALVGFRCTGKTAVGRALADKTGLTFHDADVVIEERAGKTIAAIFQDDGEPAFRAIEVEVTADLCAADGVIIATGGGAVMNPDNVRNIRENCFAVLLEADPVTILGRMTDDPETARMRPALTDLDRQKEIEHLLQVRADAYQSASDIRIDTSAISVDEVVDIILREFESSNA